MDRQTWGQGDLRVACSWHDDQLVGGCRRMHRKRIQTAYNVRGGTTIVLIGLVGLTKSWTEN